MPILYLHVTAINSRVPFLEIILEKIQNNTLNWADARHFFEFTIPSDLDAEVVWDWFFEKVADFRFISKNEPKILKIYTPGGNFPAISVTGTACELHCEHCDHKYLSHMWQAPTQEDFSHQLEKLVEKKCIGALLSGGCTQYGEVPVVKYKEAIREFKEIHPEFYFNSHVGLIDYSHAIDIRKSGIDTVSFDLTLDPEVITNVFHLDAEPEDYIVSYTNLQEAGVRVIPHVLVGADFGKSGREIDVLKIIAQFPAEMMVFIVMIPQNEKFVTPDPSLAARLILLSKIFFPTNELSLGCMRPRGKTAESMEKWAILAGANRIEIPRRKTIDWAQASGFELKFFGACCAIAPDFEAQAEAIDVRGRLKPPTTE